MMRSMSLVTATAAALLFGSVVTAAEISGEYLEARSCDVYTGPCFANAEMDVAGKEALMAWKVDAGRWNGVSLDGLGAALVVRSERTLGDDGVFAMKAGKIESVVLVDERASQDQHAALVAFVKDSAPEYTQHVRKVRSVPFTLENDHLSGKGVFSAGDLASIETRQLRNGDCICTNEIVFYQPLTKVENFSPAYSLKFGYKGDGLDSQWTNYGLRSSFLATFRR